MKMANTRDKNVGDRIQSHEITELNDAPSTYERELLAFKMRNCLDHAASRFQEVFSKRWIVVL